jgi:hypothetical protein
MLDLDKPVRVSQGGEVLYEGQPQRLRKVLAKTLAERGDPKGMFCSELRVQLLDPEEAGDQP